MGCGNVNDAEHPEGDFYQLVATQVPTRKIAVRNYAISLANTTQLSSFNLDRIKELNFEKCHLNHETIQEISQISFPALVKLNLNDNELGPIGCRILSGSALISNLTELSLNSNKIKDVGLKALANADLKFIEDLSLSDNNISTEGIKALRGQMDCLECLNLGSNRLNDGSIADLNYINPKGIYYLKLSKNEISERGLQKLIEAHRNLDVLLIDRNQIKDGKERFKRQGLFLFY